KKQIAQLGASISEFGFLRPIIVDAERAIVAGHGTWLAAKELGLSQVPIIAVGHLSAELSPVSTNGTDLRLCFE
ncbi:MAG: ParB N-terminal domain-containing protein, partial [Sandaracinobacter sp.]